MAVQSHWFAIGPLVPWAEAGVGAVATQSFVDPSYGKLGLDIMRLGRSGPDALKGLLAADLNREVRQVAIIDSQGRVTAHTGSKCIPMAGHQVGSDMNEGDLAVERNDHEGALRAYAGAEGLVPDNSEMIFWHAVALVNMKRVEESLPLFAKVFKMDPNWKTLTPRLVGAGLLPDDQAALKKILEDATPPVATGK